MPCPPGAERPEQNAVGNDRKCRRDAERVIMSTTPCLGFPPKLGFQRFPPSVENRSKPLQTGQKVLWKTLWKMFITSRSKNYVISYVNQSALWKPVEKERFMADKLCFPGYLQKFRTCKIPTVLTAGDGFCRNMAHSLQVGLQKYGLYSNKGVIVGA